MRFRRARPSVATVLFFALAALGCVKPYTGPNVALIEKEQAAEDRYVEMQPKDWAESCEQVAENRAAAAAAGDDLEAIRRAALRECQIERGISR